jgi:hypothetical protein
VILIQIRGGPFGSGSMLPAGRRLPAILSTEHTRPGPCLRSDLSLLLDQERKLCGCGVDARRGAPRARAHPHERGRAHLQPSPYVFAHRLRSASARRAT